MSEEITRVKEANDPNRCQHVIPSQGQCWNLSVAEGNRCLAHGGNKQTAAAENQRLRNYRISQAKIALIANGMNDSDSVKNLRDEILLLRMLLQEFINVRCQTSNDLVIFSGPIADLVMKVTTVVEKCHKLEGSMGQLMDKQGILQFATEVIQIVSDEFQDEPERVSKLADKLFAAVGRQGEQDEQG